MALIDSYSETNIDSWFGLPADAAAVGQSFTATSTVNLASAKFFMTRAYGSETGNAYAKLYAHTGTFGTSGTPTGSALATSNAVDVTTIGAGGFNVGNFELVSFTFATPYELQNATNYFITVEYGGGNYLLVGTRGWDNAGTDDGNLSYHDGSNWAVDTTSGSGVWDMIYYVYGADAVTSSIKSVNSLAKASIKSVNGLAIASVKSINGLA